MLFYLFQHLLQVNHHQDSHFISGAAVSVNLCNDKVTEDETTSASVKPTVFSTAAPWTATTEDALF